MNCELSCVWVYNIHAMLFIFRTCCSFVEFYMHHVYKCQNVGFAHMQLNFIRNVFSFYSSHITKSLNSSTNFCDFCPKNKSLTIHAMHLLKFGKSERRKCSTTFAFQIWIQFIQYPKTLKSILSLCTCTMNENNNVLLTNFECMIRIDSVQQTWFDKTFFEAFVVHFGWSGGCLVFKMLCSRWSRRMIKAKLQKSRKKMNAKERMKRNIK